MKLYLDDVRDAPEGWTLIRNPYGVITILADSFPGEIEALSFDHDLAYWTPAFKEITGYTILSLIEEMVATNPRFRAKVPDEIYVHSANPAIRKKMEQTIDSIRRLKNG